MNIFDKKLGHGLVVFEVESYDEEDDFLVDLNSVKGEVVEGRDFIRIKDGSGATLHMPRHRVVQIVTCPTADELDSYLMHADLIKHTGGRSD